MDQPIWFDLLDDVAYVYQCYLLKMQLNDPVRLIEEYPAQAELIIEIDRARGLIE